MIFGNVLKGLKELLKRLKTEKMKDFLMTVSRKDSADDWTLSNFDFNGVLKGVGVEDEQRDVKIKGETRVDNGLYPLALRHSPKFSKHYFRDDEGNLIRSRHRNSDEIKAKYHTQHELIHIKDTPRHSLVLIHWGNTDDNTDACYLVGTAFGVFGKQAGVTASRNKYEEIYPELWRNVKKGGAKIEFKEEKSIT